MCFWWSLCQSNVQTGSFFGARNYTRAVAWQTGELELSSFWVWPLQTIMTAMGLSSALVSHVCAQHHVHLCDSVLILFSVE